MGQLEPPEIAEAEADRLAALRALGILDTAGEGSFDDIVALALSATGATMGAVSLVDHHRQWFLAEQGIGTSETARDVSFCAHALRQDDRVMVVCDASLDPRFATNPLVTGPMHVRFYAGAPLVASSGAVLGALCVLHDEARSLSDAAASTLRALARQVVALIEARKQARDLAEALVRADDADARARVATLQLEGAFAATTLGLVVVGPTGAFQRVNPAFASMLGYTADDLLGRRHSDLTPVEDLEAERAFVERLRTQQLRHAVRERRYLRHDGSVLTVLATTSTVTDLDDNFAGGITIVEDIAARRTAEQELLESQSALDAIISIDSNGTIVSWNDGAAHMLGWSRTEAVGRSLSLIQRPDDHRAHVHGLARVAGGGSSQLVGGTVELIAVRRDGTEVPVELSLSTWTRQRLVFYTGILRDVSSRHWQERHDADSDLLNLRGLTESSEVHLQDARDDAPVAVVMVHVDRFREVAEGIGHDHATTVLRTAGERVRAATGHGLVGRTATDAFAVVAPLAPDAPVRSQVDRLLLHVRHALARPIEVDGIDVTLDCRMGASLAPHDGDRLDDLLRQADAALHHARDSDQPHATWHPSLRRATPETLKLASDAGRATERGELLLHHQPVWAAADLTIIGTEALVRWQHPARGLIAPGAWLPLLEQTDAIHDLTAWVIDAALADAATWPLGLDIAINLSGRSLARLDLVTVVDEAVRRSRIDAACIILEITETAAVALPAQARQHLEALRERGFRLAIDDFGAGNTSLAMLTSMPFTELKIDRSLIVAATESPARRDVAGTIISLAHRLGLDVVVEGVEDQATLDLVQQLGADRIQGFHLARPEPAAAFQARLADRPPQGDRSQRIDETPLTALSVDVSSEVVEAS